MIRLLLLDDDEMDRILLSRRIHNEAPEAEIVLAADVGEALTELGRGRFHLIVSDMVLPGADGVEIIAALQTKTEAPIVAFTGLVDDRVEAAVRGRGVAGWMSKRNPNIADMLACAGRVAV